MKKSLLIPVAVVCLLVISAILLNKASGQSSKETSGKPIPENITKILEKACAQCHSEPGNGMALAHFNMTKWDKYSPEKQAAKAKDVCKMLTKDKMPPKKFKEAHPDALPTKDDVKAICDWSQSLQPVKK
jgi:hypothetical protein